MEVFQSAAVVHKRSYDHFISEPLIQFMIYCHYEKFIKTGSIAENYKINNGCTRPSKLVTTIALKHVWNHFQVTPRAVRLIHGGTDTVTFSVLIWSSCMHLGLLQ
jgi:hypothetical protein